MRDTRAELLMHAEALVRGRGFAGFSYADLADAVGIRKASIHHHFRTKEELGLALLAAYDERYDGALDAILAASSDAVERIEAYGRLYLSGVEVGKGCLCAAFAVEFETLPERLRMDVSRFLDKHIGWVRRVLAAGRDEGSVDAGIDPSASARLVVAALEGALLIERLLAGPDGFEDTLEALCDSLRPGRRPSGVPIH